MELAGALSTGRIGSMIGQLCPKPAVYGRYEMQVSRRNTDLAAIQQIRVLDFDLIRVL